MRTKRKGMDSEQGPREEKAPYSLEAEADEVGRHDWPMTAMQSRAWRQQRGITGFWKTRGKGDVNTATTTTGLPGDQPQGGGTTTVQTPDQPRTKCVLVEFVSEDDHVVMLTALPSTGRMHQYTPQGPGEPMSAGTTITDRRNRVYYVCPFNFDGDADWAVTAERR